MVDIILGLIVVVILGGMAAGTLIAVIVIGAILRELIIYRRTK